MNLEQQELLFAIQHLHAAYTAVKGNYIAKRQDLEIDCTGLMEFSEISYELSSYEDILDVIKDVEGMIKELL